MHDKTLALDGFLRSVERRAFKLARFAARNDDDALDIVQDAMMRLVKRYAHKPEDQWPMLFHRILQNAIRDWQRRALIRARWTTLWSSWGSGSDESTPEPEIADAYGRSPEQQLAASDAMTTLAATLERLPLRQQQAFLLRHVEGLDVPETARAMACSQGSVKTHTSRALKALKATLGPHWTTPEPGT